MSEQNRIIRFAIRVRWENDSDGLLYEFSFKVNRDIKNKAEGWCADYPKRSSQQLHFLGEKFGELWKFQSSDGRQDSFTIDEGFTEMEYRDTYSDPSNKRFGTSAPKYSGKVEQVDDEINLFFDTVDDVWNKI